MLDCFVPHKMLQIFHVFTPYCWFSGCKGSPPLSRPPCGDVLCSNQWGLVNCSVIAWTWTLYPTNQLAASLPQVFLSAPIKAARLLKDDRTSSPEDANAWKGHYRSGETERQENVLTGIFFLFYNLIQMIFLEMSSWFSLSFTSILELVLREVIKVEFKPVYFIILKSVNIILHCTLCIQLYL